jgi:hypothetical protein
MGMLWTSCSQLCDRWWAIPVCQRVLMVPCSTLRHVESLGSKHETAGQEALLHSSCIGDLGINA